MTPSLECRSCGATHPPSPSEPWRCECGHALDFADPPRPPDTADPADTPAGPGLWRFADFLPAPPLVTLGEGNTPLVPAPEWNAAFKLEYVSPSGSFKDRGATVMLSRAADLGVERVADDSSGNAGAAIAQYAARAGLQAEIFVPDTVKPGKLRAIESTGASVTRVPGSRHDVTTACVERVESSDAWYASHAWNPAFFAGTMTFALEVCAQRDWTPPDAVVTPVGHGTLFLGAHRGFTALAELGWIDRQPAMYGGQAAGYAPIAERFHDPSGDTNDAADGIQIKHPARADQIAAAATDTGGDVVEIGAAAVRDAQDRLHRHGFFVEATSAVAPATLQHLRDHDAIQKDADVVVPLTGSGLKE